ncbi:MAG TPA: D-amino acid aminotransferase [Burkholderiales bacterium]|nr:D-amino acid aminotransferase [Burkholderiales bacterium]
MVDTPLLYLNGEFLPPQAAKVSVFDRGFMFSDGAYEFLPVFGRRIFRLAQHLERLDNSLHALGIANPLSATQWQTLCQRLIDTNRADDQSIYIHITRGVAPRDHHYPGSDVKPTVFAYAQPLPTPTPAQFANGVSAITAEDIRWSRCDIKATALLANAMLRQRAVETGAVEAILLRDGFMTEGAACNIFIVEDGRAVTPRKSSFILPGITRDLVLELMHAGGMPCEERAVSEAQLRAADEIWLTSSSREILAIVKLDGEPIGNGRPGPAHARALALYRDYKQAFIDGKVE